MRDFVLRTFAASSLLLAACSGSSQPADSSGSQTGSTAPPTTSAEVDSTTSSLVAESTTSTSVAPSSSTTEVVASAPLADGSCESETPANLPDAPQFKLVPEDQLFDCFGVEFYRFVGSQISDLEVPDVPGTVAIESAAILVDGEASYRSVVGVDGEIYNATRLGDEITVEDPDGSIATYGVQNPFAILELPSTRGQLALAGAGFVVVELYAGGAIELGTETINDRTVTLWEAGPDEITSHVNGSGYVPLPIEVNDGFVRVWTDSNGLVMKVDAEVLVADVTVGGAPLTQIPGVETFGFFFGSYSFEYVQFDGPVTIP